MTILTSLEITLDIQGSESKLPGQISGQDKGEMSSN